MPEWLYEAGIGEARAALVEADRIVEAAIELENGLRVGQVARARLIDRDRVRLDSGEEAQLAAPAPVPQGGALTVEITREVLPERGRAKLARCVHTDAPPRPGPDLLARIEATGLPIRRPAAHEPDLLEAAGWSELLEEATEGEIAFPGGALRMSPTPAMTLFDVDGDPPLDALALRAAAAVGQAIRRHGIGGSIGVDFPTIAGKAQRQAIANMLDANLTPPFERTNVNGFGFLQIVRPRPRPSLPEQLRADPAAATARALLRRLEREPPGTPRQQRLNPAVLARFQAHPAWLAELARRTGVVHQFESL